MGKKGHGGVKQESEGDCAARLITIVFCLEREERAFILGILNFTCYVCRLLTRV